MWFPRTAPSPPGTPRSPLPAPRSPKDPTCSSALSSASLRPARLRRLRAGLELVYIKDHNVWLANPDGTGQRQLTTDGFKDLPYESPSQADDGTILAGRGLKFVKLDRQGKRIGALLPSILVGKPANASPSGRSTRSSRPDGHKLVYWIGTWSTWFDYGTNTTWTDPRTR